MNRQTALSILEIETEFPTKDEVRAAYIRQIKRNHPDCFFGTNPETQTIAENNTKLINEAREVLEEWVSFNNRSPISNSDLSRKENQRDDSRNNSNERDSKEQDNRKTQTKASHQPFKEKTSNPTNNSTNQRSEKKPPFSHDLFLASLIVFVVLAINSWVLLSFILSIATGTALFFSSASIVPATLIGLAGSLCFKYKSSTSKNRSAKKTRKVRRVNERAMRWLERVGNTIVLTVSVIFFWRDHMYRLYSYGVPSVRSYGHLRLRLYPSNYLYLFSGRDRLCRLFTLAAAKIREAGEAVYIPSGRRFLGGRHFRIHGWRNGSFDSRLYSHNTAKNCYCGIRCLYFFSNTSGERNLDYYLVFPQPSNWTN